MLEERIIEKYFIKDDLNMQKVLDDYYNYIGTIIKNFQNIKQEDEEEIISDVFFIVWKNKGNLDRKLNFSPYIAGITKRVIYKKYRQEKLSRLLYEDFQEEIIDDEKDNTINSDNVRCCHHGGAGEGQCSLSGRYSAFHCSH